MSFDYFYGQQSDLFTFYRVPKVLFTNERFWNISADAKMLYGILLDRMSLSAKNGWIDKNGRVYIIFTIDEAKMALNCAEQKAIKLLSELEKKAGLIERKRQGLGKPNLIYVKNFISAVDTVKQNYDYILLDCMQRNSTIGELMERKRIQDGAKEYQGHTYMDLARFDDATKHMIIFDVLTDESPVGWKGERNRLYLSDVGYQKALDNQKAGNIKIISHAAVAKGNLYYDHRDMAR